MFSMVFPILLSLWLIIVLLLVLFTGCTFYLNKYLPIIIIKIAQVFTGVMLIMFTYAILTDLPDGFPQVDELTGIIIIYIITFYVFGGIIYALIRDVYKYLKG